MAHIAVIDTSVALHGLHNQLLANGINVGPIRPKAFVDDEVYARQSNRNQAIVSMVKAQVAWLMSGYWLGDLLTPDTRLVFVGDYKNSNLEYWRHAYMRRPEVVAKLYQYKLKDRAKAAELQALLDLVDSGELDARPELLVDGTEDIVWNTDQAEELRVVNNRIKTLTEDLQVHYKAGRSIVQEPNFRKLKEVIPMLILDRHFPLISKCGYEADDVAAAIVRANDELAEPHQITLCTIDSDWLGMVSDRVRWFCLHGYHPRLRDSVDVINAWWTRKTYGKSAPLDVPTDMWARKVVEGDKSDNLPKGSPAEVIDLFNPPQEHKLWLDKGTRTLIDSALSSPSSLPVVSLSEAEIKRYLAMVLMDGDHMVKPCIRPFIRTYEPMEALAA